MRFLFVLFLAAGVLTLAGGCGKKDSASGGASLEGTYLLTGMEMGGEKFPDDLISKGEEGNRTIRITGDTIIAMKDGKEDPATYTTDKSKNPPHINMAGKKGGGQEEKMYGIYKLEGDTLTICMTESDKAEDRPKEFKTEKNGKSVMMTLTKKK